MRDQSFQLGRFIVNFETGVIKPVEYDNGESAQGERLEPKTSAVLHYLVQNPHIVISKESLINSVWSDVAVSDDALLRCISKLRKVLGDKSKFPTYIETIPKRGYRLICDVRQIPAERETSVDIKSVEASGASPSGSGPVFSQKVKQSKPVFYSIAGVMFLLGLFVVGLVLSQFKTAEAPMSASEAMLVRADNYYHQIRQTDNEMAISLYEQVIAMKPDSAAAQAGLANALVQKSLRWSAHENAAPFRSLGDAFAEGKLSLLNTHQNLSRALALAERAVRVEPDNVKARKALGFVLTSLTRLPEAMQQYDAALELDPLAWQVLINAGEIQDMLGDPSKALNYYQRAFNAMTSRFQQDIVQIRPWYADLGALVAERQLQQQFVDEAEIMYRRVLAFAPLHTNSVLGLSRILIRAGDYPSAKGLCETLNAKTQATFDCSANGILRTGLPVQ